MTENDKDLLMNFLGETDRPYKRNFESADDMMAVKDKLVEKGLLIPFSIWAWENRDPRLLIDPESGKAFWEEPYVMWFWELMQPARFCELALQFLRGRE